MLLPLLAAVLGSGLAVALEGGIGIGPMGSFCECRFCDCESGDYYDEYDEDYEYGEDEANSLVDESNGFMPDHSSRPEYPDYSRLLQLNSSGDSCNCDFCQCQHGFGIEDPPLEPLIHVSPRKTDNGERWRWPSIARGLKRPLRKRRRKRRRGQRPNRGLASWRRGGRTQAGGLIRNIINSITPVQICQFIVAQLCGLLAGQVCTTANLNNDNFLVLGVCNFGLANACNFPLAQVCVLQYGEAGGSANSYRKPTYHGK